MKTRGEEEGEEEGAPMHMHGVGGAFAWVEKG
jgi:hypothetical protein